MRSEDVSLEPARENRLIASLSEDERTRIEPHLQLVDLKNGEGLLRAGEKIEHIWFPNDCITSTVVDTPEGQTIEVGLMGLDGVVGVSLLLGRPVSNTTVIVQIPGSAYRMRTVDVQEHVIAPHGEFYDALLQYTDAFMAMVAQTAACNSLHEVQQRMARWILLTQDRIGRDNIPLTQEFLSYMLGVRRASVSVAASTLQDLGLIRYSRGNVEVVDRQGLEKAACACYRIVRDITEKMYGDNRS
jgi:CRP-like cAMP-binding protein